MLFLKFGPRQSRAGGLVGAAKAAVRRQHAAGRGSTRRRAAARGMEQALPVGESAAEARRRWAAGLEPEGPEEYLLHVRFEAEGLPRVLAGSSGGAGPGAKGPPPGGEPAAAVPGGIMAQVAAATAVERCDPTLLPDEAWQRACLEDFVAARSYLRRWAARGVGGKESGRRVRVPALKDAAGWEDFCFGTGGGEANLPGVELLLQLDQVATRKVLAHHIDWLSGSAATNPARLAWIYGLLARLERPLDPNGEALVRKLYRHLLRLRAGGAGPALAPPLLAHVNLLITVAGQFFAQAGEEERRVVVEACERDGCEDAAGGSTDEDGDDVEEGQVREDAPTEEFMTVAEEEALLRASMNL